MPQHKLLHLAIVDAAPVGSGQECPADLDLAFFLVVTMETRRPNHPLSYGITDNQRTTGRQSLVKEYLEAFFFMAILDRMLFPNEPISRDGVELTIVFGAKRPHIDEVALQNRLIIKRHSSLALPTYGRGRILLILSPSLNVV